MDEDAVTLTVVSSETEAETICDLLRSGGLECAYRPTPETDSLLENFTDSGPQEIRVHAADLEKAKELLP
jgi:hypothetical protein